MSESADNAADGRREAGEAATAAVVIAALDAAATAALGDGGRVEPTSRRSDDAREDCASAGARASHPRLRRRRATPPRSRR